MRFDAIIVPRGAEVRAVARGWSGPSPPLVAVAAGLSAARTLTTGQTLETALVLGLCGALDPELGVGEAVVYARIADGSESIELDERLTSACALTLGATPRPAANVGAFVGSARAKALLRVATGADVIDMEAAALARVLTSRGVRVAMVRVVSDDAAGEMPDLSDVYDERGSLRPLALVLAFTRTPRRSARFITNVLAALTALRATSRRLSA